MTHRGDPRSKIVIMPPTVWYCPQELADVAGITILIRGLENNSSTDIKQTRRHSPGIGYPDDTDWSMERVQCGS